ncbi:MAG: hypothetical protein R2750_04220 [Bacteroidales bacterium]
MLFPDPTNDDCANAIPINEVTDLPFSTVGATASGDNPGCEGDPDPVDIWYAYTASTSGLTLHLTYAEAALTRLAIWDACGGNLLACNDGFGPVCFAQQSSIKMQVAAGVTYYVQVGGNDATTGTGDLTIFLDIPGLWTGAVSVLTGQLPAKAG